MVKILADAIVVSADINMGGASKLINVVDGTAAQDSATKAQVDAAGAPTGFTEIEEYLQNRQDQIQFTDDPSDAAAADKGAVTPVKIGVTDSDGVVVPWPIDHVTEVTLTVVGNTTGDTPRANGVPIGAGFVVDMSAANEVTVNIDMDGTGEGVLTLGLSDSQGVGLDVTDEFQITYTSPGA